MWNCGNLSLRCQGRSPSGDHHEASVPMRSTGTDQPVRARKAGHAAGAKGLGQAVVVNVQLATGGDLGGNEAVRHPGADAVRLLGGSGVSREAPAPFCERPEVKLLRPTRHRSHYVRDVTLAEDASRIRINPGIMARLRSYVLNIARANGAENIARALWIAAIDPTVSLSYKGVQ